MYASRAALASLFPLPSKHPSAFPHATLQNSKQYQQHLDNTLPYQLSYSISPVTESVSLKRIAAHTDIRVSDIVPGSATGIMPHRPKIISVRAPTECTGQPGATPSGMGRCRRRKPAPDTNRKVRKPHTRFMMHPRRERYPPLPIARPATGMVRFRFILVLAVLTVLPFHHSSPKHTLRQDKEPLWNYAPKPKYWT